MWKTIQTLYLIISTGLIFSMFFCTFATIIGPDGTELSIGYHEKIAYLAMIIMLFTAHVAGTASFKAPFLQARVCAIAALMAIGFQIWLGVDYLRYREDMVFSFTMLFPLAAALLDLAAAKKAMVDEMTIAAIKSTEKKRKR